MVFSMTSKCVGTASGSIGPPDAANVEPATVEPATVEPTTFEPEPVEPRPAGAATAGAATAGIGLGCRTSRSKAIARAPPCASPIRAPRTYPAAAPRIDASAIGNNPKPAYGLRVKKPG